MRYLMMICGVEGAELPADEQAAMRADTEAWVKEMDGRGVRKIGDRLRPTDTATTVRVRDGETLLADGPFAETKEQILGFDLIECADLEEAVEVASRHPSARYGSIEVRPLWPFEED
ncbi:YciI family protein [Actinomadura sp. WMMA1423]|uniref:YciI family protein n=1 Tax=Actinomadura sp. WMMA1423 TaxID=2591108 RepID=UPI0011466B09|nr:YciI family protein [Actinomadura sp. WMMA1423]